MSGTELMMKLCLLQEQAQNQTFAAARRHALTHVSLPAAGNDGMKVTNKVSLEDEKMHLIP